MFCHYSVARKILPIVFTEKMRRALRDFFAARRRLLVDYAMRRALNSSDAAEIVEILITLRWEQQEEDWEQ